MIMNCVVTMYDNLDNLSISVIWCFSKSISLREVYQYHERITRWLPRTMIYDRNKGRDGAWDCAKCIVEFATL